LAAPLGALPPVKIHCAQLVEGALRSALSGSENAPDAETKPASPTLLQSFAVESAPGKKVKVVLATDKHG
jgi:nitrogen fixation NifU-like protein